jgi:exonuclease VII small subunit
MNEQDLVKILNFSKVVIDKDIQLTVDSIKSTISIANILAEKYYSEKEKLPYHLNLIDELRADENAHSRILVKLLRYNRENSYKILESFMDYISKNSQSLFSFNRKFKKPKITAEKHRVDALIIDIDFAIIIENKIRGAIDQPAQLSRYIELIKNKSNIQDENIYIIYLTAGGGSPSPDSFSEDLKTSFIEKKNYIELSYRAHILPWLEDLLKDPSIAVQKEEYLISALYQYIDYLQGMFNVRDIDTSMNKELVKIIKEKLELKPKSESDVVLDSDYEENIKKIAETIENLDKTKEYLDRVLKLQWFKKWRSLIENDYKKYEIVAKYDNIDNYPSVGVILNYNNTKFSIIIQTENSSLYYGVCRHEDYIIDEQIKELLGDILQGFDKRDYGWWYGSKHVQFENAHGEFKSLVAKIELKLKNLSN